MSGAFQEGAVSAELGLGHWTNPYIFPTVEAEEWLDGFIRGQSTSGPFWSNRAWDMWVCDEAGRILKDSHWIAIAYRRHRFKYGPWRGL